MGRVDWKAVAPIFRDDPAPEYSRKCQLREWHHCAKTAKSLVLPGATCSWSALLNARCSSRRQASRAVSCGEWVGGGSWWLVVVRGG